MKKNLRAVKIGHGAYSGANALKIVVGKAAAVRELRERGFKRDDARSIVNRVSARPNGYEIAEVKYNLVEVLAMNTDTAWEAYPQY